MKKNNEERAILFFCGIMLDEAFPIKDLRPIYLTHIPAIKLNEEENLSEPICKKAVFEHTGKIINGDYVFNFIKFE